jgi:Domain of unknown function (DUF4911)
MICNRYIVEEKRMFTSHRRFFRVDRRELAYLKFIVEAYEGLTILSTVEKEVPVISITSPSCLASEIDLLLAALSREVAMTETTPFPHSGPLNTLSPGEKAGVRECTPEGGDCHA